MVLDIIKQIRECQDTSLSNPPSQVCCEAENRVRLEDLSSKSSFELPAVITLDFSKSFNLFGPHFPHLVKEGSRPDGIMNMFGLSPDSTKLLKSWNSLRDRSVCCYSSWTPSGHSRVYANKAA